ncbi:MAG: hypothetical protein GFH27_549409n39 [Chloroflexi bacterium AL-W]|nr:hypothetical protein [Chloroflexi bacterium AL-N1]NOK71374.1 hypothetical protein [Chloroflexi bacterium AL-N10]NOK78777.1 hypothetical protein [Chloroflexi bacterium AL-N5]NOK86147.1 hypothetical protein [Chloroflexi bacterium AL-W]NOK93100.1 hypothetical protein [Chloroflexi bacterium AL-N15]
MFAWITAIHRWWRNKRLIDEVCKQLESGTGFTKHEWPKDTDVTIVLDWFEVQLSQARRPYGFHAALLLASPLGASKATMEVTISEQKPWLAVRDTLIEPLEDLLSETPIKTVTIAIGTAMSAILTKGH